MARHIVGEVENSIPKPVVVLANGNPPSHRHPLSILNNAATLICADGAATTAVKLGRIPDVIIGDMDSMDEAHIPPESEVIAMTGQHNTDLEKVLDWCVGKNVPSAILLGLSGMREDHMMANFAVFSEYSHRLQLTAVTDYGIIHHVAGNKSFDCESGATVSLLLAANEPTISSHGLKYTLKAEKLKTGGHGISNRAEREHFSLEVSGGSLFLIIGHID
jgi:thiamine pyrophosphokinase